MNCTMSWVLSESKRRVLTARMNRMLICVQYDAPHLLSGLPLLPAPCYEHCAAPSQPVGPVQLVWQQRQGPPTPAL